MTTPRLLDAELPEIDERWRWLVPLALAPFAIGFGLNVTVGAVYYEWSRRCRPMRWLSAFYGVGSYHYVHHSARPEHATINLGNWFFMFWDRVFGTYVAPPEQRPPTGLTGQPALHWNPLRLALAGLLQLAYELRHNRGLAVRWRILTGESGYAPPISRDYALRGEP